MTVLYSPPCTPGVAAYRTSVPDRAHLGVAAYRPSVPDHAHPECQSEHTRRSSMLTSVPERVRRTVGA
eukprot:726615-Rhodomonas_salina.1